MNDSSRFGYILFEITSCIADYILLSILWVVTSLPVVTIGASTSALFYSSFQLLDNKEGHLLKDFFRSFSQNFKQATLLWLAFLAVALLSIPSLNYYQQVGTSIGAWGMILVLLLLVMYVMTFLYIFPYLSKFNCTFMSAIKNAFLISIRFFGWTVVMLAGNILICWFSFRNMFLLLILPGTLCFLNSFICRRIFRQLLTAAPAD